MLSLFLPSATLRCNLQEPFLNESHVSGTVEKILVAHCCLLSRRQFSGWLLRADTEGMLEDWASLSGPGRKLILDRILDSQFASPLRWFTSDDNRQKIKRTSVRHGHPPILFSVEGKWELFSELPQSLWKIWDPFVLRYGAYLFFMWRRQTVDNNTEGKAGILIFMPLQYCSWEYICWCLGQPAL